MIKKILFTILIIITVILGLYLGKIVPEILKRDSNTTQESLSLNLFEKPEELTKSTKKEKTSVVPPSTLDNKMLFAPQAPFGNWDLPYQEACEEASSIMVARFFNNQPLDNKIMDEEIHKLIDWQKNTFGYYEDTTAEETARMIREYFNLQAEVTAEVTVNRIKKELNAGNFIIVPVSGRLLDNPYFSGTDPFYHMLVIRGYDRNEFITNDPGTKRGEGFKYKYENLINAVHNWTGSKETINEGEKAMIIVGKKSIKN